MEFRSIKEVAQQFDIPGENPEEIRKKVRKRLANVHPDFTGGKVSEEYWRLNAALNYLNKPVLSTDIAPQEKETELAKQEKETELAKLATELVRQSERQDVATREEAARIALEQKSAARIRKVRVAGNIRFGSVGVLTGILTWLWFVPDTLLNKPLLGPFLAQYVQPAGGAPGDTVPAPTPLFTYIWVCAIFITVVTLLFVKWRTEWEALFQRTLNLERTQNLLFSSFSDTLNSLDFSHLGGIGIDMLLTQLHLKRSCRCLPSADHSDGALSSFQATSLITRLRTRPPWYLGTFCGLVSHHDTQIVSRDFV
jgi:hypothetical protein